jgi:probable addiction module antidote protein
MAKIANTTGLGRESLYKALVPGAKPRFETIMAVLKALDIELQAVCIR